MVLIKFLRWFKAKPCYGCCEKSDHNLNFDVSARVAMDPHSRTKIDKANAFVTMISNRSKAQINIL